MAKKNKKTIRRTRIKRRIRKKISGTADRPRLTVFRSNKQIYAQVIDDVAGQTLVAFSSFDKSITGKKTQTEISKEVGKSLAERCKAKGIENCVFDRNGFRFHGRVKALAEGAREGGLVF